MYKLKKIYQEIKVMSPFPKLIPGKKYKWINDPFNNDRKFILTFEKDEDNNYYFIDRNGDYMIWGKDYLFKNIKLQPLNA